MRGFKEKYKSKNKKIFKEIWSKYVINVFYPKTCPFCDNVLDIKDDICPECIAKLKFIDEPRCKKCGKALSKAEQEYCYDCTVARHLYKEGVAAFVYDDMVSKSIYRFKYHNRRTYAQGYGKVIGEHYRTLIHRWGAGVIIPIPIHQRKMQKRGYNQAELIAKELSLHLGIPMDSYYLKRVRHTKPQKELNKSGRKKNLENAFKITSDVVKYRKVILVDDIYTTGSTIDECAKVLMAAGTKEVYFVSLSIGAGI